VYQDERPALHTVRDVRNTDPGRGTRGLQHVSTGCSWMRGHCRYNAPAGRSPS
jgi:hypothetical protein